MAYRSNGCPVFPRTKNHDVLSVLFRRDTLGAKVSPPQDLPDHGVTVVFVELSNTKVELLRPLGEDSPIQVRRQKCTGIAWGSSPIGGKC